MAIKKNLAFVLLLAVSVRALPAQWKDDVAGIFRGTRDYKGIVESVMARLDKMDAADKPDASGLLAFCFNKLNDKTNEIKWIAEYFETYRAGDSGYAFIDLVGQAEVIAFLSRWKGRYPFVPEIALIAGVEGNPIIIQGILPLGFELTADAYYKFSEGSTVIKAGLFKSGPNILSLDANDLFLRPGKRTYFLELKAGELILKKEIDLDIEVSSPWNEPKAPTLKRQPLYYRLSLYIGGELVMASQKTENAVPLKLDVKPNQNPFGYKPDYYVTRNNPGTNYFSIFSAIGLLYQLFKDLLKKKDAKAEPPKIQLVQEMTISNKQKDTDGNDRETKVSIKLKTKNLPYVLSVP
jgi:hypothetical protein